ncbi:MAG: acetate--CoA ligase [Candidatus Dormiibacterota bacterium]
MSWATIHKPPSAWSVTPNLLDYDEVCKHFTWDSARSALDGLPGGRGLNIAHEAVDRHVAAGNGARVAVRWRGRRGEREEWTYAQLSERSDRFAGALRAMGVPVGERVFALLPRIPDLYVAALGTLKARCVFSPLFAAFGPQPIAQRLRLGQGSVLVTTESLYRRKVAGIRQSVPDLIHVLISGGWSTDPAAANVQELEALLTAAPSAFEIEPTDPEEPALLHFTSGTTGTPKGAVHVHAAAVMHHHTGHYALDLHPGDVFWCTADPGWVTGTSYGIFAPLLHGITMVVDEGEFDAERWYGIIESERVSVWYTAPTAVRMLMKTGADVALAHDLSSLRFVASVGEPLNPEGVIWGQDVLGLPIHDNWWQTETGGIMIANFAALDIQPGSMGRPLPGVEATVLRRDARGNPVVHDGVAETAAPGEEGELALRPGWPSMFRTYLGDEERYRACFVAGWYRTGDLVRRGDDGYFWFVGRGDDVIKSAGHLIGPFEVESTLMEHPAVAEAGVIGVPDPVAGEAVKAFVSLHRGYQPTDELRLELIGFARSRLGAAVAPKDIAFDADLPMTKSGKIMRRVLKARELGLPVGDLSTLEETS